MQTLRFVALVAALAVCAPVHAQPDDKKAPREPWESFTDAAEVKAYLEQAKAGAIDAAGRATLTTKVLPLLEDPANVRSMDRLRRRIRESLLNERTLDAASLDAINGEASKWAAGRVAAAGVNPVTTVNAMLLVGDLRGKDGKPWPGATPVLATAAADAALPLAARAAALASLARQADAGVSLKAEGPRLLAVATTPPAAGSGEAGDWLASRALGLLPLAMPDASPEAAAALVTLLADASRSVDVRVRAAEALGRMAAADAKIDAASTLEGIRTAAVRGLQQDLDAARDEEFGLSLSGGGLAMAGGFGGGEFAGGGMRPDFGSPPGGGQPLPAKPAPPVEPTILERDAWRLAALASAIQPAGKGRGLVTIAGDAGGTAKDFAARLRENALILHEWIHPKPEAKKQGARGPAAGGEFAFNPGGEMGATTQPTKQEFGQALADALADLEAVRPFKAAAAARPAGGEAVAPGNDPFGAP
ncbi:MAG: hypothetical protein ACKO40_04530 [Planctomycetaceae bacterium]